MKNLIFLTTVGVLLLTGCSKEEINEQTTDQSFDSVYILTQVDDQTILETTSIDAILQDPSSTTTKTTRTTMHTEGYFISSRRDGATITWNGTQSSRGVDGTASVQISSPTQTLHFIMKTECVNVDGNEAVYGGVVTRVIEATGEGRFLEVGWRFYFKVVDYDGVSRSELDKISNARVFVAPRHAALCGLDVRSRLWGSDGYQDITSPGFVTVE